MATVQFSPIVSGIRASVADATFSVWKGRPYLRSRVTPANPNSVNQQLYRSCMRSAVKFWQALHAELVAHWNQYATPYQISGYNAQISDNATKPTRMRIADSGILQATPADPSAKAILTFNAVTGLASKGITVTWDATGWGATDTGVLIAWLETGNTYYDTPDTVKDLVSDFINMSTGTFELTVGQAAKAYTVVMSALQNTTGKYSTCVQKKGVTSHA